MGFKTNLYSPREHDDGRGIDSCPIEGFYQEKAEALLREKFDINTDKYGLSFMVAFGNRKANPPHPKSRRGFNDIVSWK
ncbi:hypothetical protein [uncultured Arcticibacterium sp.]|uniref:hypothetical protein n=1 Tax=uncultured Arcticibacterium sp. TaxID=2173042 RepID=UPI0030FA26AC